MNVDLFDFDLPEDKIALRPAVPRDSARLLHISPPHSFGDFHVSDLPALLRPGDALVYNDTRVIPARLYGKRYRNDVISHIETTLHKRISSDSWQAFVRPAKRLRQGDRISFSRNGTILVACVAEKGNAGEIRLVFDRPDADLDAAISVVGHIPLPPYIATRREGDAQDKTDYQTVYARKEGAVAAPTAGLHFTPMLLEALEKHGIEKYFVTLHVGAGTFLPVQVPDTKDHKMHAETGHIDATTAQRLMSVKARGGRIIAVGTTALRLLESASSAEGHLQAWSGETDIFITPGYQFRFVDRLVTNFHLPRSTLFMLVSAFSGCETMTAAYKYAITNDYRFYSYGDASLLDRI